MKNQSACDAYLAWLSGNAMPEAAPVHPLSLPLLTLFIKYPRPLSSFILPPSSLDFNPHINPLHLAILHHLVRQSFRERRAEIDHQQSIGDGE